MSIHLAESAFHRLSKSALSRSGYMHSIPLVYLFTHEPFLRLISCFESQIRNLEECSKVIWWIRWRAASTCSAKRGQGRKKDHRWILKEEMSGSDGALNMRRVQESASHRLLKRAPSCSGDMHSIPLVFWFIHQSFLWLIFSCERQIQNLESCPKILIDQMVSAPTSIKDQMHLFSW